MLQSLHVKNIALIDDVEIEFSNGLNILTGETGAGKSILIDSVNFALGGRVNKGIVRDDADYALSELVFAVENSKTLDAIRAMDIHVEDGEIILQRRISNGKTSCRINGESVPTSLVKEVAALLIDIHGQHEHQSLLYKKNHKLMLDGFCGADFEKKLDSLAKAYNLYKEYEKEYADALSSSDSRQKDLDYSQFVVTEIENANLTIGEDEKLENDFSRMNNSRKISEALQQVRGAMSEDNEGAGSLTGYALSQMKIAAGLDEGAKELFEILAQAEDLISDFNRGLYEYEESLEFSPEEYALCEERLNEINRLKDKYGSSITEVLKRLEEESSRIEKLQNLESYKEELSQKKQAAYEKLKSLCAEVSAIRAKEGKKLEKEIAAALDNLNFLDARFEIKVTACEDEITAAGYDDVEFMISTNPGEALKPLTQVASGGELSRIMLALKSVLAKRDVIETLIFDEIDTGISGKTAQRVADRMSDIAKDKQVICITHLPQIASHADAHFLIEKSVEGSHTATSVSVLAGEEKIEEVARMLAGETITDAVRENAREMIRAAKG